MDDQQNLSHFYKPGSLQPIAQRIAQRGALATIAQNWQLPLEIAMDMARLALFDTMLLCDDSASMCALSWPSRLPKARDLTLTWLRSVRRERVAHR